MYMVAPVLSVQINKLGETLCGLNQLLQKSVLALKLQCT